MDDAIFASDLKGLQAVIEELAKQGRDLGYHEKLSESQLLLKKIEKSEAQEIFE